VKNTFFISWPYGN